MTMPARNLRQNEMQQPVRAIPAAMSENRATALLSCPSEKIIPPQPWSSWKAVPPMPIKRPLHSVPLANRWYFLGLDMFRDLECFFLSESQTARIFLSGCGALRTGLYHQPGDG